MTDHDAVVNGATGETELPDGTKVLYTLDAIERVETRFKAPIMSILTRARRLDLTVAEMRALVQAGMEGYRARQQGKGPAVTDAAAAAALAAGGALVVMALAARAVAESDALGMAGLVDLGVETAEEGDGAPPGPTTGDDSSPGSP